MTKKLTYDSERLIGEWRDRYTNRRTVERQMLNEAELLVRDAVVRELEQLERDRAHDRERRAYQAERAVEIADAARDRAEARADRVATQLAEYRARHVALREEREAVTDGTVVKIAAPEVPYSGYDYTSPDRTVPRWTLEDLESATHRLRMAGAGDDAVVGFEREHIRVAVPFPEFALTPAKRLEPRVTYVEAPAAEPWWARLRVGRLAGAAAVLLILLVVGLVVL